MEKTMTPDQRKNLLWLRERGGVGYIDRHGRVNALGEPAPRGAWIAWLNLVAAGFVTGGMRRLNITVAGEKALTHN